MASLFHFNIIISYINMIHTNWNRKQLQICWNGVIHSSFYCLFVCSCISAYVCCISICGYFRISTLVVCVYFGTSVFTHLYMVFRNPYFRNWVLLYITCMCGLLLYFHTCVCGLLYFCVRVCGLLYCISCFSDPT